MFKLLNVNKNLKTIKNMKKGYLTGVLYLAPHTLAGGVTVCPHSTPQCREHCLVTAGAGRFDRVMEVRIKKTQWFLNDQLGFLEALRKDIDLLKVVADVEGLKPSVRLNGTSDILWETIDPSLFEDYKTVEFYDYTKYPPLTRTPPSNYRLTYSWNTFSKPQYIEHCKQLDRPIAFIYQGRELPKSWNGYPVEDGDDTDCRNLDGFKILGLRAKGKARKQEGLWNA